MPDLRRHRRLLPSASGGSEPARARNAPKAPFNSGYRLISPLHYLVPRSRIQRILAKEEPDLVEVCDKYSLNWLAGLLRVRAFSSICKRPAVVGLSCERMDGNFRPYLASRRLSERFCRAYMQWFYFPLFDHHITVSDHTAGELRTASGGHRVRRGVWIRTMGVDLSEMSPARRSAEARRKLLRISGGDERTVLVLYAGRMAREKNLEVLIGMMAHLAADPEFDCRLLIAGSGTMRQELARSGRITGGRDSGAKLPRCGLSGRCVGMVLA